MTKKQTERSAQLTATHATHWADEQIPYGGFVNLESLTPEQRCTWRYWGTRQHLETLAEKHPDANTDTLQSLYAFTLRIYRMEIERLQKAGIN